MQNIRILGPEIDFAYIDTFENTCKSEYLFVVVEMIKVQQNIRRKNTQRNCMKYEISTKRIQLNSSQKKMNKSRTMDIVHCL